jgi:hypothetical protein
MRMSPIAVVAALAFVAACTDAPTTPAAKAAALTGPSRTLGNGFPEGGQDYRLSIIGVPKNKTASMDNNSGRRIFVQLWSDNTVTDPGGGGNGSLTKGGGNDQNHIYLCNSTNGENDVVDSRCDNYWQTNYNQFGVIDANGTDGDGAILAVPDPCADALASTACTPSYSVWARALAGGSATLTTCADETGAGFDGTDNVWCGSNGITLYAKSKKAVDISGNLLYMTITVDGVTNPQLATCLGTSTTGSTTLDVFLFDNCFENYFWNYDNNGLKNLELRFYKAPAA